MIAVRLPSHFPVRDAPSDPATAEQVKIMAQQAAAFALLKARMARRMTLRNG